MDWIQRTERLNGLEIEDKVAKRRRLHWDTARKWTVGDYSVAEKLKVLVIVGQRLNGMHNFCSPALIFVICGAAITATVTEDKVQITRYDPILQLNIVVWDHISV